MNIIEAINKMSDNEEKKDMLVRKGCLFGRANKWTTEEVLDDSWEIFSETHKYSMTEIENMLKQYSFKELDRIMLLYYEKPLEELLKPSVSKYSIRQLQIGTFHWVRTRENEIKIAIEFTKGVSPAQLGTKNWILAWEE